MSDYLSDTRRSYDVAADGYATWIRGELATKPLDRAVLTAFADLVAGPVADIGCGAGRITAFLNELGVAAHGIDLSPRMIAAARRDYPHLRFTEGSMTALDIEDGSLGGVIAWYSTIHVPDADLQLAFQVGDEVVHRTEAGGHEVSLDFHRRQPDRMADLLRDAGFTVRATLLRAPDDDGDYPEITPQAYVLARQMS